eukprot:GHVT01009489.1.p1 GENE.GHVT01009489.1~~GHVT01009489.1.p1  ORF type:complete len:423 (+),score=60.72 GHVT01009489.1:708-1976(+)
MDLFARVPLESIVDVLGWVVKPTVHVEATSQKVEVQCSKIFCVSKAANELPFQLKDASLPEQDETNENASATSADAGSEASGALKPVGVRVHQDVRLDNRVLDLRTMANQAIFRVQAMVCQLFREHLMDEDFTEIHSPKLIGGASEGGSNCFTLKYFNQDACLAQSPQLYKQMVLCADFDRVFEIGPVFRAENSNTYRHLCEFVGLDLEMTFKENYHELLDVLDQLFNFIFIGLEQRCQPEIAAIHRQYPAKPFEWTYPSPRFDFEEGIEMLRASGFKGIPEELDEYDLSTEAEKVLGELVFKKYKSEFFMLLKYPSKVRPFYTMPDPENPKWSNSYDFFMRGAEIVSGAQRVHDASMLASRCLDCGIPLPSVQPYIDAFKLGAFPHGGAGIGLERVVMLFLGLNNVRKTSLFPRDPKRLTP